MAAWQVPNWAVLAPVLTGFLAVVYMLPTPRPRPALVGLGLTVLALLGVGFFLRGAFGTPPATVEAGLFGGFALLAVLFGTLMITQRNPARSAICFTVVVLSVCGLFLLLAAPFLMASTIIIYAGAIIVTFLFVLMLSQQANASDENDRSREPLLSAALGFLVLATLLIGLQRVYDLAPVEALIARAERFAEAPLLDDTLLNENTRQAFLNDALAEVNRLQIPRANEGADPLDRDPTQYAREALQTLAAPESYLNVTPISRKNPPDVVAALTQLRDGLRHLRAIRLGTLPHATPVALSPHGQVAPVKRPEAKPIAKPEAKVDAKAKKDDDDDDDLPRPLAPGERPRQLPSGNVAAIGRLLFTDHLIAIELGGTLLLVATIGAILIAGTRREKST